MTTVLGQKKGKKLTGKQDTQEEDDPESTVRQNPFVRTNGCTDGSVYRYIHFRDRTRLPQALHQSGGKRTMTLLQSLI